MLTMALEYRIVVDNITSDKKLWCYELDEEDWQIISDLNRVLKVYKDATLFFSADNVASITNVILMMDHIDKMLNDDVSNTALTPSVHAALGFACTSLDKCCSGTGASNQHGWAKDWIDTAAEIVREEWNKYKDIASGDAHTSASVTVTDTDFSDIPMDGIEGHDELQEYLSQPIKHVCEPLKWWWGHCMAFPKLSKMAFNYLSIPGLSTTPLHTQPPLARVYLSHLVSWTLESQGSCVVLKGAAEEMLPCPMDDRGIFTKEVPNFGGLHVKATDSAIQKVLKANKGHLIMQSTINHSYPHCWRSGPPLIYHAIPAWFYHIQAIVDDFVARNEGTRWQFALGP
ncbi:hypothetical protein DXG01_007276 [Tephrocybe rancida]|nr:hypothetical protein DXG01_007276 [Tephrocybe rancida]